MNQLGLLYIGFAFIISWLVTFCAMPWLLKLCKKRGLYDIPDERKVHHTNNIPRLGGVAFVPAMLVGVAVSFIALYGGKPDAVTYFSMPTIMVFIGMFMLYLIGILDDLFGMKASVKFAIQLIVSMLLPCCGLYINDFHGVLGLHELPLWVGYTITVFISLVIVNAVNLIDGIDGLASSLAFLAILCFGTLYFAHGVKLTSLYCAGLCGSVLAFMYYNLFGKESKSTKTFMGDTGSLTLGYALAFLGIRFAMYSPEECGITFVNTPCVPLLIPFTLLAVPCFDLVRVALVRLFHGLPIFHPDKRHIHHKCLRAGFSMHTSLMLIVGFQLFLIAVSYALVVAQVSGWTFPVFDVACYLLFMLWLDRRAKVRGN